MTFEESVMEFLEERGMYVNPADTVLNLLINSKGQEAMAGRWGEQVTDYPPELKEAILSSVRAIALRWIDKNKPFAWYRYRFVEP